MIVTLLLPAEYGMCLVSLNSRLRMVGGQTTLTECFNPDTEEWIPLVSMKERGVECRAVTMLGCVQVTGVSSSTKGTYLQRIKKYNPHTQIQNMRNC